MAKGNGAYLLEKSDDSPLFQLSVGNLPPGKTAKIKISYCTSLSILQNIVRFVIPTNLTPMYYPEMDTSSSGMKFYICKI